MCSLLFGIYVQLHSQRDILMYPRTKTLKSFIWFDCFISFCRMININDTQIINWTRVYSIDFLDLWTHWLAVVNPAHRKPTHADCLSKSSLISKAYFWTLSTKSAEQIISGFILLWCCGVTGVMTLKIWKWDSKIIVFRY